MKSGRLTSASRGRAVIANKHSTNVFFTNRVHASVSISTQPTDKSCFDTVHLFVLNDTPARVPIIVTGNDLSTLYAPLLRDGRMDKFLWAPDAADKAAVVFQILQDGGITEEEAKELVDEFPEQPMDFFGAIHARTVGRCRLAPEVTALCLSERLTFNYDEPPLHLTYNSN